MGDSLKKLFQGKKEVPELPEKFPKLTDWIIFSFPAPEGAGAAPLLMKLTSANPEVGTASGIVFFDPGLDIVDDKGEPAQVPLIFPLRDVPYSSRGKANTWMTMADLRRVAAQDVSDDEPKG